MTAIPRGASGFPFEFTWLLFHRPKGKCERRSYRIVAEQIYLIVKVTMPAGPKSFSWASVWLFGMSLPYPSSSRQAAAQFKAVFL